MKVKALFAAVLAAQVAHTATASDVQTTVSEAFANGTVDGLVRYGAQYRNGSDDYRERQYSAFGGFLGFETAPIEGFSGGVYFYSANPVGNNPCSREGLNGLDETGCSYTVGDETVYTDKNQQDLQTLARAYLKFQNDEHLAVVGRQELPFDFVGKSDMRFDRFAHEAAFYQNNSLENLTGRLAYVKRVKGWGTSDFIDMAEAVTGNSDDDDKAMYIVDAAYAGDNFNVKVADYYVEDLSNLLYLYGDTKIQLGERSIGLAAQYGHQSAQGDELYGDVDSWFYGVSVSGEIIKGMSAFISHMQVDENDSIITTKWGNVPLFMSFQTADSEDAGTVSYGGGLVLDLPAMGLMDSTVIRFRHGIYNDIAEIADAPDHTETTMDIRYAFNQKDGFGIFTDLEGLSSQIRIAYINNDPREGTADVGHFWDYRLYIDYRF